MEPQETVDERLGLDVCVLHAFGERSGAGWTLVFGAKRS